MKCFTNIAWTHICAAYKFSIYLVCFCATHILKFGNSLFCHLVDWIDLNAKCIMLYFASFMAKLSMRKKRSENFCERNTDMPIGFNTFFLFFFCSTHCLRRNWEIFSRNSIELVNKHPLVYSLFFFCLKNKTILEKSNKQKNSTESKCSSKWNWKYMFHIPHLPPCWFCYRPASRMCW